MPVRGHTWSRKLHVCPCECSSSPIDMVVAEVLQHIFPDRRRNKNVAAPIVEKPPTLGEPEDYVNLWESIGHF